MNTLNELNKFLKENQEPVDKMPLDIERLKLFYKVGMDMVRLAITSFEYDLKELSKEGVILDYQTKETMFIKVLMVLEKEGYIKINLKEE